MAEALDEVVAAVVARGAADARDRNPAALEAFARALLRRVPTGQLALVRPDDAAAAVVDAFDLLDRRDRDRVEIRVVPVAASFFGPEGGATAVEVAATDRPLLYSTVSAAVERFGLRVLRATHPILGVERSAGRLVAVGPALRSPDQEVLVHVEVAEALDQDDRDVVAAAVTEAVADLERADRDASEMRAQVAGVALRIERSGPLRYDHADCSEVAALCRWFLEGNFLVLGSCHVPSGEPLGVCASSAAEPERPPPLDPERALVHHPLLVRRSLLTSRVHRSERLGEIVLADLDHRGRLLGALRVVGLTTVRGRSERPSGTPWVRRKLAAVLEREQVLSGSHDETVLRSLFDDLPWDVLLLADDDWLHATLVDLLDARESGRPSVHLLAEPASDALTVVVSVAEDEGTGDLADDLGHLVRMLVDPTSVETSRERGTSGLTTLTYVACLEPGRLEALDLPALQARLRDACRSWSDRLADELTRRPEDVGPPLGRRWLARLPAPYRQATPPVVAAADLVDLDAVAGTGGVRLHLLRSDRGAPWFRLRAAVGGAPLELSRFLPVLESCGLVVAQEMTFRFPPERDGRSTGAASVMDLVVARRDGGVLHPDTADDTRLVDTVLACWSGRAEVDRLNELVLTAGLGWDQVAVLRAYVHYLAQVAPGTRPESVIGALAVNPEVARALWDRFAARFAPLVPEDTSPAHRDEASREVVVACCDAVKRLDHDRLLRALLGLVDATVRTNVFATRRTDAVVLKFDGGLLPGQDRPVTWRELWVSGPDVQGVHLRAGPVARGGLRWSDREGDVRTEVLQLMQAQELKNALIVPTGAKGGFVLRDRPDDPAELRAAVERVYTTFVRSLLDVTDDVRDGVVVRPAGVRAADHDDPYLVVAADRGTAAFSDLANALAAERGFWLDDAFASGGSDGYDHKALGVTARGAWVSVTEHFEQLGVDVAHDPFTCIGIGDMSGDVFGNGMLRSRAVRLVAAFDHRHVFLDPDPDPGRSWEERDRLFRLPRSSWDDYDRAVLSPGAMIVPRSTKRVELTEEVRALLGIDEAVLALPDLVRAVLRTPADLLYFGGIGTFVKATEESHGSVGDPADDDVRVDAADLRVRVVAEGANLGMTPRARVEFSARGGLVNSDAIDNSAGVDSSDHEVNLKILLGAAERRGTIDRAERNGLLAGVAEDVVSRVLDAVAKQNRALTRGAQDSAGSIEPYLSVMFALEADGRIDRTTHALPSGAEVRRRRESGDGLLRPELAVLLAASKEWLANEVLGSDLPDRPPLRELLEHYFPDELAARFDDELDHHRLRREIVSSRLANEIVDRMGITWVPEGCRRSGAGAATVAGAYWMARETARIGAWWRAIDRAPLGERDVLWDPAAEVIDALAGDYLRRGVADRWEWREVERNAVAAAVLARWHPEGGDRSGPIEEPGDGGAARPGEDPARRAGALRRMALAAGLAEVAEKGGRSPEDAVGPYLAAGERFGLDRLTWAVLGCDLDPGDTWAQRHRESLLFDLDRLRRAAAGVLLAGTDDHDLDHALDRRLARSAERVEAAVQTTTDRLDPLDVVVAELWLLVEEVAGGIPRG